MARILDPLTCGFAKVFMYELFTNRFGIPQTGNWKENANKRRFEKFCLRYKDTDTSFYKSFVDKGPGIIERIQLLGKNSKTAKAGVLKCFSTESWEKLSTEKKEKHSFYDCNECLRNNKFKEHLEQIPTRNKHHKRKAFDKNFKNAKENALKERTNQILQETDENFRREFKTTFTKQVKKKLKINNKKKESKIARAVVNNIQEIWSENSTAR